MGGGHFLISTPCMYHLCITIGQFRLHNFCLKLAHATCLQLELYCVKQAHNSHTKTQASCVLDLHSTTQVVSRFKFVPITWYQHCLLPACWKVVTRLMNQQVCYKAVSTSWCLSTTCHKPATDLLQVQPNKFISSFVSIHCWQFDTRKNLTTCQQDVFATGL
jgi:hypothetical protein